jgi:hypothetical protein
MKKVVRGTSDLVALHNPIYSFLGHELSTPAPVDLRRAALDLVPCYKCTGGFAHEISSLVGDYKRLVVRR